MIYENLKEICRVNKISLASVAKEVGLTPQGLQRGIQNGSLGWRYIMPLCNFLHISPNVLFGIKDDTKYTSGTKQMQNGGVGNTQIVEDGTATLQEQLREKDKQIDRLLTLLEKK